MGGDLGEELFVIALYFVDEGGIGVENNEQIHVAGVDDVAYVSVGGVVVDCDHCYLYFGNSR